MRDSIECLVLSTELQARSVVGEKSMVAFPGVIKRSDKKILFNSKINKRIGFGRLSFISFGKLKSSMVNLINGKGDK